MTEMWDLKDPLLPKNLWPIRDVFLPKLNDRQDGESLHDYFIRRKLKCPCRICVKQRKVEAQKDQETMF